MKDEDAKKFGARLKYLRERLKLNQTEAAINIEGISYGSLQRHEAGHWPNQNNLQKYIDFYGCDRNWLLTGEGEPYIKDRPTRIIPQNSEHSLGNSSGNIKLHGQVEIPKHDPRDYDNFALIPMAEAHLSAGGGAFVLSEAKEYYAFRKDWVHRVATSRDNLVLMTVRGFSMEPTIHAGDVVLIDTGRKRIYDGNIYALGLGETIVIKRLELLPGDRVRIISDNRTEYPPENAHLGSVRIIGQIIWLAKELVKGEE
ncbi:MAG: helix-turn-helix transcriptional regulator [Deltaproteobacteria bacterium]|nr:helix-turn-helix transcriptional regulator [Deltaproteobacteria bacterium]